MGFDPERVRADFPILATQVHGKPLVFLDSAASAQKPDCVIEAVSDMYRASYANVERGVYELSLRATQAVEDATLAQLDGVAASGLTDAEVEMAKRQLHARMVFENDSVTNVAHQLGYFQTVTSLETYAALPERIVAVTSDDVTRVARLYLQPTNRTIGWFEPSDS